MINKLRSARSYGPSLTASWKEGIPAAVMISVTDFYLIPLGLLIGAKVHEIGLLVALPQLLGAAAQLAAVKAVDAMGSRRRFLVWGCVIQALLLLPVAFLPYMAPGHRVWLFIALIMLFRVMSSLIATVWGSQMSDYLIPEERGKYLGWRNRIAGISGVTGLILGGLLLQGFRAAGAPELGFCLLLLTTAVCRLLSAFWMSKLQEIRQERRAADDFSFPQFISRFRESNFVRFALYVSGITFAAHMTAPYVGVHLIDNLQFNYAQYMAVFVTSQAAQFISFPIWGRHADIVGNARVLKTTSLLLPLIPIYWIFVTDLRILLIFELLGGFVWGGFNLCSANYIFDAVTPEKRVRCLAYFSLLNGTALFLGAMTGGFLAERVPQWFLFRISTLFLLGSAMRFAMHFILSRGFKEVRSSAREVSSKDLFFSVAGIRPITDKTSN
jgi:MFS family permease